MEIFRHMKSEKLFAFYTLFRKLLVHVLYFNKRIKQKRERQRNQETMSPVEKSMQVLLGGCERITQVPAMLET
jgi:hypothetical protein